MRARVLVSAALAIVLALPLAASLAFAEPPAWSPPDERLEGHLRELGLDSRQLEKLRGVLAEAKQTREEIDGRLQHAFDEMRVLLEQEAPDEAAVMKQADRIGAIRTEGRKAMLRTLLTVRADLTPAQRERLNEMMRRDGPPGRPGLFRQKTAPPGEGE